MLLQLVGLDLNLHCLLGKLALNVRTIAPMGKISRGVAGQANGLVSDAIRTTKRHATNWSTMR